MVSINGLDKVMYCSNTEISDDTWSENFPFKSRQSMYYRFNSIALNTCFSER
jgi:hypothetical protein